MQQLQEKQRALEELHAALAGGIPVPTIEERIDHYKDLEYHKHAQLFAVGHTSIHKAAMDGSIAGIKCFLEARGGNTKKVKCDDYDKQGVCPIHYAAQNGWNEAIEYLVSCGCKIDVKTSDGRTALMYASKEGHLHTIRLLCELRAKIWEVNKAGLTPFHFAAQADMKEAIETLIECFYEQKMAIMEESESDQAAMEELMKQAAGLLDKKIDKKEAKKDDKKETKKDDKKDKKKKEESGDKKKVGNITIDEIIDKTGGSLTHIHLHRACQLIRYILELQILEIKANTGMTALHIAASYNALRVMQYLIDKGVSLATADNIGELPIHKAGRSQLFGAFKLLSTVSGGKYDELPNLGRETPLDLLRDNTKNF